MINKELRRLKRHRRIRVSLRGSQECLRLAVCKSLKNISAQLINDDAQTTILSLTTLNKELRKKIPYGGNIKAAVILGEELAKKMKEMNITKIAFDRGGYLYHGRIKAFADGLRKGGIKF